MLYVTPADIAREEQVIDALAARFGCDFARFPARASPADWIAHRDNEALALVEVKTRTTPSTKYPTYMIDRDKLDTLATLAAGFGVMPLLVVRFTDGVFWLNVAERPWPVETGGRRDRNDPRDIDLVYQIPTRLMKRIRPAG